MTPRFILFLNTCLVVHAVVLPTPSPEPTILARRQDAASIPTFTFGPSSKYFPSKAANPEPSGSSLQIFPTGIYDKFPDDGITVDFGPNLQGQIKEMRDKKCGSGASAQDCHSALASLLQDTDMSTHVKRFTPLLPYFVVIVLVGVLAHVLTEAPLVNKQLEVKFDAGDLSQLYALGGATNFVAVTAGASTAAATLPVQPAPTTTASEYITVETLTADKDSHKAGSVVYHIPQHAAERIHDFLAMTGIGDTQNVCKGQDVKRADTLDQCLQQIQRHALDLADAGPSNLLQLAPRNIPRPPGSGQAIDFPVDNLAFGGIIVLIPVYRGIQLNTPTVVPNDQGWDPAIFTKSAVALTIAVHAAMFAGQSLIEIWVDKDDLVKDLKPEQLSCPKDLVCTADECQGQEDGVAIDMTMSPFCKQQKLYSCKCEAVYVPHVMLIEHDYMDNQYAWLQELDKTSLMPQLTPSCSEGDQALNDAANKVKEQFKVWCLNHEDLKTTFYNGTSFEPNNKGAKSFTFGFDWVKKNGDKRCNFDCEYIFSQFWDSKECIYDKGMQKNGVIRTECGDASYIGYQITGLK